jgi:hypothetical protein
MLKARSMAPREPSVSVVVISDYAAGLEAGWNDLRRTLEALAEQDFEEQVDFLLVESARLAGQIPGHLLTIVPTLRVVAVPHWASYELKNAAVQATSTELVAMLDGDCSPARDWLRQIVSTSRAHPDAAVVSGKTTYAGQSLLHRTMEAVTRSYVDVGRTGPTRRISNNNALFQRSAFLAHPLPTDVGPFAAHMQAEAILRAGGRLLFEPRARVVHAYEGWATEWNFRRAYGYGVVRSRRADRRVPYAGLLRLGYLSIPLFVAGHILTGWWYCLHQGRDHGMAWYELPVAFAFAAIACVMEAPGMFRALRNRPDIDTLFR